MDHEGFVPLVDPAEMAGATMNVYVPQQLYVDAVKELASLLDRTERDFQVRVRRLFVHQPHKFRTIVIYRSAAEGAVKPERPRLEMTKLMEFLLTATRERDYDKLTIIEHRASLPGLSGID